MKPRLVHDAWGHSVEHRRKSLQSAIGDPPHPNEEQIICYLDAGHPYAAVPMIEIDLLSDEERPIGCPDLLTDGVWVWPRTLSYYVRRCHRQPPPDFVEHSRRSGWRVPTGIDVSHLEMPGWQPL